MAVNPQHLSLWERICGLGKNYNPEIDLKQQIEDMRADWEKIEEERSLKEAAGEDPEPHDLDLSPEIHDYFRAQSPRFGGGNGKTAANGEKTENFALPDAGMTTS